MKVMGVRVWMRGLKITRAGGELNIFSHSDTKKFFRSLFEVAMFSKEVR